MDSKHFGSLVILLLLLGAMAASAQTDPVRDPSQGPGAQTAEKLDASEPAPIDWDQASRSALGDTSAAQVDRRRPRETADAHTVMLIEIAVLGVEYGLDHDWRELGEADRDAVLPVVLAQRVAVGGEDEGLDRGPDRLQAGW